MENLVVVPSLIGKGFNPDSNDAIKGCNINRRLNGSWHFLPSSHKSYINLTIFKRKNLIFATISKWHRRYQFIIYIGLSELN